MVVGYEPLIDAMTVQPKDRHVAAAAVVALADVIVTLNRRDFPTTALAPYGLVLHLPDELLTALCDRSPDVMARILTEQAAALTRPPRTLEEELAALEPHAPTLVRRLRRRFAEPAGSPEPRRDTNG